MTQRRPSAFKTFRCVRIVSTSASSLIGSTIPLVPSTEIPPSIPRTGLKVFFAASTPAGILIVTRTDLTSPASSRSASTASRIIFLGTELIAAAPTGWSSPGFVTRPIPMPPSITICGRKLPTAWSAAPVSASGNSARAYTRIPFVTS